MPARVIHKQDSKETPNEVYVGRIGSMSKQHYGNPFSHKKGTLAAVIVDSREEAVKAYRDWLYGRAWTHVEQDRRAWILTNMPALKGKTLVCWCAPKACHGDVLAEMTERTS